MIVCFVWFRPVSIAFRGSSPKRVSAMTRVFEKQVFEAAAAKATEASPKDVLKRFYVPIVGTLRCKYIGPQNSEENDVIVYDTNVVFKWEYSSPHVKGSVEQALCCQCCDYLCLRCCWVWSHVFV